MGTATTIGNIPFGSGNDGAVFASPKIPLSDGLNMLNRLVKARREVTAVFFEDMSAAPAANDQFESKAFAAFFAPSNTSELINKIARLSDFIDPTVKNFTGPDNATISNALSIASLIPRSLPTPSIYLSSDGEISLKFSRGKKEAVIDIDAEDTYGYAYLIKGSFQAGKTDGAIGAKSLPKDLLDYFKK